MADYIEDIVINDGVYKKSYKIKANEAKIADTAKNAEKFNNKNMSDFIIKSGNSLNTNFYISSSGETSSTSHTATNNSILRINKPASLYNNNNNDYILLQKQRGSSDVDGNGYDLTGVIKILENNITLKTMDDQYDYDINEGLLTYNTTSSIQLNSSGAITSLKEDNSTPSLIKLEKESIELSLNQYDNNNNKDSIVSSIELLKSRIVSISPKIILQPKEEFRILATNATIGNNYNSFTITPISLTETNKYGPTCEINGKYGNNYVISRLDAFSLTFLYGGTTYTNFKNKTRICPFGAYFGNTTEGNLNSHSGVVLIGDGLKAYRDNMLAVGNYPNFETTINNGYTTSDLVFVIGNGTSDSNRQNLMSVSSNKIIKFGQNCIIDASKNLISLGEGNYDSSINYNSCLILGKYAYHHQDILFAVGDGNSNTDRHNFLQITNDNEVLLKKKDSVDDKTVIKENFIYTSTYGYVSCMYPNKIEVRYHRTNSTIIPDKTIEVKPDGLLFWSFGSVPPDETNGTNQRCKVQFDYFPQNYEKSTGLLKLTTGSIDIMSNHILSNETEVNTVNNNKSAIENVLYAILED